MKYIKFIIAVFGGCLFGQLQAQATIQDCLGAVPVCQSVYTESLSPSGSGNIPNEIPFGQTCTDGESNSIWYIFTASEDGLLGFIITPANANDDYDWALFNLTNADCDDIGEDNLVSCNAAGGPGCHGPTGCTAAGVGNWTPGGCTGNGPFNALVPTTAGNTYVLMVSNWTGSPNGYTIDFNESTGLGVFDQQAPLLSEVTNLPQSCGDQTLDLHFNEYLQCGSIQSAAFSLAGPGGPYAVTVTPSGCSSPDDPTRDVRLTISPAIQSMGTFTLTVNPITDLQLLDLCDNQLVTTAYSFEVDVPIPETVNIGRDTSLVCAGDELTLDASAAGIGFVWDDGSTNPTLVVTDEGVYSVTVTTACGIGADSVSVYVQVQPPVVNLGIDEMLCEGDSRLLDADNGIAFYTWQNGSSQPTQMATSTGTYAVTVTNGCGEVTDEVALTFVPDLNLNLASEYVLCAGDTLVLDVERPFASYQWSDGNTQPVHFYTTDGSAGVVVTTLCETYEAMFETIFLVDPTLDLGRDTTLCPADSLLLSTNLPGASFEWQDGSTNGELIVRTPGIYRVVATTACNVLQDEIQVTYLLPVATNLGRDTFLCPDTPFLLDATTDVTADYAWEDGSKEAQRLIFDPGLYTVVVTSPCEVFIDTLLIAPCEVCDVYMPNIFSPNADGINDRFFPQSDCQIAAFEMSVFSRWGELLFVTNDPNSGWDGKKANEYLPAGTYVWSIRYQVVENGYPRQVQRAGDVVLLK
ncbi:MAG: gliding motility-associated C-terminal domain-containing protein [Saprospiraceae bacterium]